MNQKLRLFLAAALLLFFNSSSFAQEWVRMMHDPKANFYATRDSFNAYWANRPKEKGKGYKAFRRWEAYMTPRVYPSGDVTLPSQTFTNYQAWLESPEGVAASASSISGNWTAMGPFGKPSGGGAGRINFIRFDPTASTTMYVGAPDGGLWKTTNGGTSWTTNTDQLAVIGCSDIAIDPTNTQVMYLATGDADASDTYSTGVLKSTDGGATWNTTGLNWTANQGRNISRLLIHPTNTQIIMAFASNGIWRSTNGGTTWTQPTGTFNGIMDAEFKPGDPNIVYAAGTAFKKSTDNGLTWTTVTTGLTGIGRLSIAVTPANAAYVYVLAARGSDAGFLGLIRSTDSGTSFTTRMASTASNNILGWDNGGDAGGQGWYDLAIAASPTNAEEVYTGGVNIWRSTNGGTSFTLNAHWSGGYSKPYVHADIHDLQFLPGSGTTLFSGNDGGVFKTTNSGTAWSDISSNLCIAQQYRLGLSTSNATLLVTGHQDNGTNKMNGSTWTQIYGGDGMEAFIDRTNNNTIYGSYVYGEYYRSTNGGTNWTAITTGISSGTGNEDWLCAWHQDPVTAATLYAGGRTALYKSTNSGTNWSALGTPTGTGNITDFVIAPSNNQIIYAIKTGTNAVSKSTNGGTSFTAVSTGLPTTVTPTCITVSNTDPNIVFVTYSGYSATNKVFKSTNGGTSWTNLSTGLPNIGCNTVVFQNGSTSDAFYVGTDVGVYYRDNNTSWIAFNTGLPNVGVRDLEIYYATGRLRAATYGRGTWDSDLYTSVPSPPAASFTATPLTICAGQTVAFTNTSTGLPTSYSWTFAGGTPATSTATNPTITYNTAGTYSVTLTATNAQGSNTATQTAYITVLSGNGATLPLTEGFTVATFPPTGWTLSNGDGGATSWERSATVGFAPTAGNSMQFDNYNIDDTGNYDEMQTPRLNLQGFSSAQLTFDVAHAPYNTTYLDGLEVLISTNCGQTFTSIYSKSGATLGTAAATTNLFVPTAAQWRTETVSLNSYINTTNVIIAFRNLAGYGNIIYVDNINITGVAAPQPPVASFTSAATTACTGQTVQYTSTSTGSPTSYSWTFQGGTPATSTAQNPTVTYSAAGSYAVTLTATNANGSNSTNQAAYITVTATPTIASSTPASRCGTGTVALAATASAGTLSWYAAATGGTALGTGASFTTPSITTTTTYYVEAVNGSCTTATRTPVIATVNAIPTISGSTPASRCGTGTVTLAATASAGTMSWFTAASGGTAVGTGASFTTPSITTTTTYYVETTANGCTSTRTAVIATVNTTPSISSTTPASRCGTGTVTLTAAASAGTISWFTAASGGTAVGTGTSFTTPSISATTTYYVETTNNGCTSTRTAVVATVNTNPTVNAPSSQSVCLGSPVAAVSFTGNNGSTVYSWTSSSTAFGLAASGTGNIASFNPSNTGTATITVTPSLGGCTGTPQTFTIAVTSGVTVNAVSNQTVCLGSAMNTVVFTGNNGAATYSWTSSNTAFGLAASGTGNIAAFTPTATGTATITVTPSASGCTGTAQTFTVSVNPVSTVNTPANQTLCLGTATNLVSFSGNNAASTYNWTNSNTGLGLAASGTGNIAAFTPTAAGTATITVTPMLNGCAGTPQNFTILVNAAPTVNAPADQTLCLGSSTNLVSFSGNNGASTYDWTNSNTGLGLAASGTGNIAAFTPTAAGTATITVTPTLNGCAGTPQSFTILVNAAPTVDAPANQTLCLGTATNLVSFSGNNGASTYDWTNSNTGLGLAASGTGNIAAFTPTAAGTATITVTPTLNGCAGTAQTFTILVNAAPTVSQTPIDTVCISNSAFTLSGGSPAGGTYSGQGVAAGSFDPAIAGVGVHSITYAVTQNGCTGTASASVVVDLCSGVDELGAALLLVYPNPTNAILTIEGEQLRNFEKVELIDALGRILQQWTIEQGKMTINLEAYLTGAYTLRFSGNGGDATRRIIINK